MKPTKLQKLLYYFTSGTRGPFCNIDKIALLQLCLLRLLENIHIAYQIGITYYHILDQNLQSATKLGKYYNNNKKDKAQEKTPQH